MSFLGGKLLIASPDIGDDRFDKTVIYLCAHTEEGAMGLTINKPLTGITFTDLLKQMHLLPETDLLKTSPVIFAGGPMDIIRGFVLHSAEYQSSTTLPLNPTTSLTVTADVLKEISVGNGPKRFLIALGYAGWKAGQLDDELKQNAWLTVDATAELLFDVPPDKKWEAAIKHIGIDPMFLSATSGQA